MRRRDVVHVERRILAEQDHVEGGEFYALFLAEREVVARLVAHGQGLHLREYFAVQHREPVGRVVGNFVPARLRFEKKREGGIARDSHALDRVHLHGDFERHGILLQLSASKAETMCCGRRPGATSTASKRMSYPACSGCAASHASAAATMRFFWRGRTASAAASSF